MSDNNDLNHMRSHPENDDELISFDERYNEYYISVRRNGPLEVRQKVKFCPWCGQKFPDSLRGKWFDELEALGIDPMNDEIPKEYQSAQ